MKTNKKAKLKKKLTPLDINGCTAENMIFASTIPSKFIKVFIGIIKSLSSASNTDATEMQLAETGIKYVIEESKSFQMTAYIKRVFFEDFILKMPDKTKEYFNFGVDLRSFTELLSGILDDDLSSMKMVYYKDNNCMSFSCKQTDSGEPLAKVEDEDSIEVTTEYFVKTMESNEPINFDVGTLELVNSIIISANEFYGILNDFDRSIDEVEIKVTDRRMTLKSIGILQYGAVVKLDPDSEIFYKFECITPSKYAYKFSYFKSMLKSLLMSSKVSLITHANGILRMQLMIQNEGEEVGSFIEYNIIPNLPEEESE